MIPATLVTGASPARREAAIGTAIEVHATMAISIAPLKLQPAISTGRVKPAGQPIAALLEGFPSGKQDSPLAALQQQQPLRIARIAAGCFCCTGNLTMRVTLNRLLREQPPAAHLYISTENSEHLPTLRAMLQAAPYSEWLTLTDDIDIDIA